ncbi:MAG: hypothetical protein SH809_05505 [Rhodothermales bacterium]|nr:hypothetical protein [Rhodothermales bacterium]
MLQETTPPDVPHILLPLSPPDESLVDGESVLFEWNAVEGATRYRLEIAEDPAFTSLIALFELAKLESVTVAGVLETDGRVYHWRVFAGNDAGWSRSEDAIHGFYSVTPEVLKENVHRPNHLEPTGPLPELLTGQAGADPYFARPKPEHAIKTDADEDVVEFYREEEVVAVEREGVEIPIVFWGMALTLVGAALMMFFMYHMVQWRHQALREELASQLTYPERETLNREVAERLNGFERMDASVDLYRIPVDSAMKIISLEALEERNKEVTTELTLQ